MPVLNLINTNENQSVMGKIKSNKYNVVVTSKPSEKIYRIGPEGKLKCTA